MKLIVNEAYEPVKTTLLLEGRERPVLIPGKGWRKVEDAEVTEALDAAIAAGTLIVLHRPA
jgi:hypothetical protein